MTSLIPNPADLGDAITRRSTATQLSAVGWSLLFPEPSHRHFVLLRQQRPVLQGILHLSCDREELDIAQIPWQLRKRDNHIELWANLMTESRLSISLTYGLSADSLVVDYLARSPSPACIEMQHSLGDPNHGFYRANGLQQLPPSSRGQILSCHYQRNDLPSHWANERREIPCGDAFSATQWLGFRQGVTDASAPGRESTAMAFRS